MAIHVNISTSNLKSYITIKGIDPKSPKTLFLMKAIQSLWSTNVKRFFDRHETHYLRGGRNARTTSSIEDAFYCELRGDTIIGVIDTTDAKYINFLIYGAPPGPGAYIPALGGRVKGGSWKGIPTIYWNTWQSFFKNGVYSLISEYGFDVKVRRKKNKPDINAIRAAAVNKVRRSVSSMEGTFNGYI